MRDGGSLQGRGSREVTWLAYLTRRSYLSASQYTHWEAHWEAVPAEAGNSQLWLAEEVGDGYGIHAIPFGAPGCVVKQVCAHGSIILQKEAEITSALHLVITHVARRIKGHARLTKEPTAPDVIRYTATFCLELFDRFVTWAIDHYGIKNLRAGILFTRVDR